MVYLANLIAFILYNNGIIKKEEYPIYAYGTEVTLNFLGILLTILIIGTNFGQTYNTFIFLFIYFILRSCSGGFHASNYTRCYICSVGVYLAIIALCMCIDSSIKNAVFLPILLLGDLALLITAPSQSLVNPKTEYELKRDRLKMLLLMLIINSFTIVCWQIDLLGDTYFTIGCTLIAVAILSLINHFKITFIERRNQRGTC